MNPSSPSCSQRGRTQIKDVGNGGGRWVRSTDETWLRGCPRQMIGDMLTADCGFGMESGTIFTIIGWITKWLMNYSWYPNYCTLMSMLYLGKWSTIVMMEVEMLSGVDTGVWRPNVNVLYIDCILKGAAISNYHHREHYSTPCTVSYTYWSCLTCFKDSGDVVAMV